MQKKIVMELHRHPSTLDTVFYLNFFILKKMLIFTLFTLAEPFYMSTFGKNCIGQTQILRCWNFFQALKLLTIWSKKPLLQSCKQTFAAVCLLPLEFLLWKKFFWHGSNSPMGPSWKNVFWNCLQFIFASCWRVWTMSDMINIQKRFLEPFMASWPQNICSSIFWCHNFATAEMYQCL